MRRTALLALLALPVTLLTGAGRADPAAERTATASTTDSALRDVMWVGNNWAGTATIVDARRLEVLKRGVNLIPDKEQELADIRSDPQKLAFYLAIQQGPGEGHDQYVDDMFTTTRRSLPRGLASELRRRGVGGHREGDRRAARTASSASSRWTASAPTTWASRPTVAGWSSATRPSARCIEYSMVNETVNGKTIAMGDRLRRFESGETPHENNYTEDGSRIFHASIGKVYTPGD